MAGHTARWAELINVISRREELSSFRDFGSILESYGFIFAVCGCISLSFCCSWIRNWRDAFADDRDRNWRANAAAADRGTITGIGEEEIAEKGADKYLYRMDNSGRFVT